MSKKRQKLVYPVKSIQNGEVRYSIQSFTNGEWIDEYGVNCPESLSKEAKNNLLRDFGDEVRRNFVKEDQVLLFGKEPPVIAAVSFGKQLRQFHSLSGVDGVYFFQGFSS